MAEKINYIIIEIGSAAARDERPAEKLLMPLVEQPIPKSIPFVGELFKRKCLARRSDGSTNRLYFAIDARMLRCLATSVSNGGEKQSEDF